MTILLIKLSKMINEVELKKFLYSAKLATYTSGKTSKRYANYLKEYKFKQDSLLYRDIYYGSLIDAGFEVVYLEKFPIWSMAYRGGMISCLVDSKICFSFLKKALENTDTNFPVRGPKFFETDNYSYRNLYKGCIFDFVGNEIVLYNNTQIYLKKYIGGVIMHYDCSELTLDYNSMRLFY